MTRKLAFFLFLLTLAAPVSAGFYTITNRNDAGPGSLRQGILDANSGACSNPCRISFQETRPSTIDLQSPLPPLTASNVRMSGRDSNFYGRVEIVIRGSGAGPADGFRIERAHDVNITTLGFEGFSGNGIVITESSDIEVACDATNNGDNGVAIVQSERVRVFGGLIAGNRTNGVYVTTSNEVEIRGGLIGGDFDKAIGNGANGIHLQDVKGAQGAFNIIRNNAHAGIVTTGSCERVDFEYNHWTSNGLLAIDVGGDGVTAEETPDIESATHNRGFVRVRGRVKSQPNARVRLLFYLVQDRDPSGFGEGFNVIHPFGSFDAMHVRTDSTGVATFEYYFPAESFLGSLLGQYLTATATRVIDEMSGYGEMSEFGRNAQVVDDEVSFVVTNTADSGGGSLRSAIEQSNSSDCIVNYPCEIVFRIAELPPPSGVFSIQPRSPLPPLQHSSVTLDGGTQRTFAGDSNPVGPEIEINGSLCGECNGLEVRPGTTKVQGLLIRELTINGFSGDGILVSSPDLTTTATAYIDGCYIGTDPTGTHAVPNAGSGIRFVNGFGLTGQWTAFLRTRPAAPNLISGNGRDGITSELGGYFTSHGSLIGTDISGLYPIPNGENGVRTRAGSELRSNTIAFNRDRGVLITNPDHQNAMVRNQIHSNGSLGVDLFGDGVTENGTPGTQNAPEIISARAEGNETRVVLKLDSTRLRGNVAYLVSIHSGSFTDAQGRGEGKTVETSRFLEGGETSFEFVIRRNLAGKFLSATAVKFERFALYPLGTSSEFSKAMQVTTDACPTTAPTLLGAAGTDTVTFSWSAVPGIKTYILWSMKPGDMPRRLFEGTATEATIPLDASRYEWWVEARFENCYGTQSEHLTLSR